jgi:hypothetical protein
MGDSEIAYFETRVIRHRTDAGTEEYAIHEVYYGKEGEIITHTLEALSPRRSSLEELKSALITLLEEGGGEITTGDLNYSYPREYIEDWLCCIDDPPIESLERATVDTPASRRS